MQDTNSPKPNRTSASLFLLGQSYLSIVLVFIQGIVLVPLYLEQINIALYGGWLASGNLLAYLSLFDFGLSGVINQKVAQAYGAGNRQKVAQISGTGIVIGACISLIIATVGILLASYIPYFVNLIGPDAIILRRAVVITAIASSLTIFAHFLNSISFALQRSIGVGISNLISWSVGICITFFSLKNGWGIYSIPFGYLARSLLMLIGIIWNLTYSWRKDIGINPIIDKQEIRNLINLSGFMFLGRLSSILISQSDALVTASLFGPNQTAVFSLTGRAKDTIQTIPDRISSSVVSGLAHLSGEGISNRTKKIAQDVLSITLGITAVCAAGIIGLNKAFVTLWVGEHLFGGLSLTIAMCCYFFLTISRNALNNLLLGIGEIRIPNILSLIESIVRILLVIVFAWQIGVIGIPLGALLSLLLVQGVFLTKLFVQKFEFTKVDLRHLAKSIILYPVLAFSIGLAWSQFPQPTQWLTFIGSALSLGCLLSVLLWLLNEELRNLTTSLSRRLLRTISMRYAQPTG